MDWHVTVAKMGAFQSIIAVKWTNLVIQVFVCCVCVCVCVRERERERERERVELAFNFGLFSIGIWLLIGWGILEPHSCKMV